MYLEWGTKITADACFSDVGNPSPIVTSKCIFRLQLLLRSRHTHYLKQVIAMDGPVFVPSVPPFSSFSCDSDSKDLHPVLEIIPSLRCTWQRQMIQKWQQVSLMLTLKTIQSMVSKSWMGHCRSHGSLAFFSGFCWAGAGTESSSESSHVRVWPRNIIKCFTSF